MVDEANARGERIGGFGHLPVLLSRVTELLAPSIEAKSPDGAGAVFIDCTLGMGGHTEHLLTRYAGLRAVGVDTDQQAIAAASDRLACFGSRFTAVHARFDAFAEVLRQAGVEQGSGVDAVLFDLGVSSMQLDNAERGFSYSADVPLDMRMDTGSGLTAADVVNTYTHAQLRRVLAEYGEERFASRIASRIVRAREKEPMARTGQLVDLLYSAIPAASRRTGGHPAKRTFQALRIEVNGELDVLRSAVPLSLDVLGVGGRAVFMAYQSLEDKVVKRELVARSRSRSPQDLPVELPGTEPEFAVVTRGAERADEQEIEENPRSAPVRLRCVQRVLPARRITGS